MANETKADGSSGTATKIAVELCCGLGGMSRGLRDVGFYVAKAYDSWGEAVAVYNHNSPDRVASEANLLSEKSLSRIKDDCRQLGDISLLAAGPPCKGFSQLRNGHHDGRNGHNRVLAAMPEYVALLRPKMVLIENVPDLIRHRAGKTLRSFLQHLVHPARSLWYRVEYQVYDASSYGTPQARRRLLVLAFREGTAGSNLPAPGPDLSSLYAAVRHKRRTPPELEAYLDALKDPSRLAPTSASQALSDLPLLGPGEPEIDRPYASEPRTAFQAWVRKEAPALVRDTRTPAVKDETVFRLKHIPPGGCARAIPDEHVNGLSRRYDSAYRRLHPDAPSTALSTKYDCVYHYATDRSLSVREYARLQGLPDSITFPATVVSRRSAYEMIGNSVPPMLVQGVLREVLQAQGA